ncbi:MAG: AAA family ATPase [Mariniblastus sp.]
MIKRIELVNFMSHERTVIEPADGLTVLVGPNNCGKSAFVSALQILAHNVKSNYVMRHGEKKVEIIIETDDGHRIEWQRTKSGSPKYIIDGETHDRLKQSVPEALHEILGLAKVTCEKDQFDVHFGEQKSPVFLLNDSGKAAAQFFASSSDAIRLVEMQDRHKTKIRESKRDHARLTSDKNRFVNSLETLKPIEEIEKRLAECESRYQEIKQDQEKIHSTEILIKALIEVQQQLDHRSAISSRLDELAPPPDLVDTRSIENLIANHQTAELTFARSAAAAKSLNALQTPPTLENNIELERLIKKTVSAQSQMVELDRQSKVIGRLPSAPELVQPKPLQDLLVAITKSDRDFANANKMLLKISADSRQVRDDMSDWVNANPACPTCGGETTVDQLITKGGHQHG